MRFIYPAVVHKREDGSYKATFPDLKMCEAEGSSVDECLRNANLSAYDWIALEMEEDDPELPPASDLRDIQVEEGDIVRNVLVIYRILEGWEE